MSRPCSTCLRQASAHELQRVGRVDFPVVDDRGQRIGRLDRRDAVEAVGALGVVGRVVDRVDRELDVGRRERLAVVPRDVRANPPRHVHPPSGRRRHAAVLERRHLATRAAARFHLLVGDRQSLDHGRLDVLEDVRAEAVEGVGLAVVADDQQIVRGAGRDEPPPHDAEHIASDRPSASTAATCASDSARCSPPTAVISRAMSGTGMAP